MPLYRRIPKFGFTNFSRVEYVPINVQRLDELVATGRIPDGVVTPQVLHNLGIVAKKRDLVKILGNGTLGTKLNVTAHAFSKSAIQKIEAVGGTATTVTAAE